MVLLSILFCSYRVRLVFSFLFFACYVWLSIVLHSHKSLFTASTKLHIQVSRSTNGCLLMLIMLMICMTIDDDDDGDDDSGTEQWWKCCNCTAKIQVKPLKFSTMTKLSFLFPCVSQCMYLFSTSVLFLLHFVYLNFFFLSFRSRSRKIQTIKLKKSHDLIFLVFCLLCYYVHGFHLVMFCVCVWTPVCLFWLLFLLFVRLALLSISQLIQVYHRINRITFTSFNQV